MTHPLICIAGSGDNATYRAGAYEFHLTADLGFGWQRCVVSRDGVPVRTETGLNALRLAERWYRRQDHVPEIDWPTRCDMKR